MPGKLNGRELLTATADSEVAAVKWSAHAMRVRARKKVASTAALAFGAVTILATAAWALDALKLKIDGKPSALAPIVVQGKTYIPLEALKAAGVGVQMNGGTVELQFLGKGVTDGGAGQQTALEGKGGEWLFNGIWRFRVLAVEAADPEKIGKGWSVKVEIRNGSKFNGYSPSGTGWDGISLVTEDGNSTPAASDAVDLRELGLAQGAGNTVTLFFPTEAASSPARVILRFNPEGLKSAPAGLRFTTANPSFRVDVKNLLK